MNDKSQWGGGGGRGGLFFFFFVKRRNSKVYFLRVIILGSVDLILCNTISYSSAGVKNVMSQVVRDGLGVSAATHMGLMRKFPFH